MTFFDWVTKLDMFFVTFLWVHYLSCKKYVHCELLDVTSCVLRHLAPSAGLFYKKLLPITDISADGKVTACNAQVINDHKGFFKSRHSLSTTSLPPSWVLVGVGAKKEYISPGNI